MTRQGTGDEGAAVDLKDLAEVPLGPTVDWGHLADVLVDAEAAPHGAQRASLVAEATLLAKDSPSALALVKMTVDRLALRAT